MFSNILGISTSNGLVHYVQWVSICSAEEFACFRTNLLHLSNRNCRVPICQKDTCLNTFQIWYARYYKFVLSDSHFSCQHKMTVALTNVSRETIYSRYESQTKHCVLWGKQVFIHCNVRLQKLILPLPHESVYCTCTGTGRT